MTGQHSDEENFSLAEETQLWSHNTTTPRHPFSPTNNDNSTLNIHPFGNRHCSHSSSSQSSSSSHSNSQKNQNSSKNFGPQQNQQQQPQQIRPNDLNSHQNNPNRSSSDSLVLRNQLPQFNIQPLPYSQRRHVNVPLNPDSTPHKRDSHAQDLSGLGSIAQDSSQTQPRKQSSFKNGLNLMPYEEALFHQNRYTFASNLPCKTKELQDIYQVSSEFGDRNQHVPKHSNVNQAQFLSSQNQEISSIDYTAKDSLPIHKHSRIHYLYHQISQQSKQLAPTSNSTTAPNCHIEPCLHRSSSYTLGTHTQIENDNPKQNHTVTAIIQDPQQQQYQQQDEVQDINNNHDLPLGSVRKTFYGTPDSKKPLKRIRSAHGIATSQLEPFQEIHQNNAAVPNIQRYSHTASENCHNNNSSNNNYNDNNQCLHISLPASVHESNSNEQNESNHPENTPVPEFVYQQLQLERNIVSDEQDYQKQRRQKEKELAAFISSTLDFLDQNYQGQLRDPVRPQQNSSMNKENTPRKPEHMSLFRRSIEGVLQPIYQLFSTKPSSSNDQSQQRGQQDDDEKDLQHASDEFRSLVTVSHPSPPSNEVSPLIASAVGSNSTSTTPAINPTTNTPEIPDIPLPVLTTSSGSINPSAKASLLQFDPYAFIASLPHPSQIKNRPPTCLPTPQELGRITLVLDLDETLVHCSTEPLSNADFTFPVSFRNMNYKVYVRKRPHLEAFLSKMYDLFEVVVFTASHKAYADALLSTIDTSRVLFHHRLFRDSCVCVAGNYLKDLSVLGRDLDRVIIVDNSPQAFGYHIDNGIPISTWTEDRTDVELLRLMPLLESLAKQTDVRPKLIDEFNLRTKVNNCAQQLNLEPLLGPYMYPC